VRAARYRFGLVVVAVLGVVDAVPMALPLFRHGEAPPSAFYGLAVVFWGPSLLPTPPTSSALLNLIGQNPLVRLATTSSLAWVSAWVCFRFAKQLRAETVEARMWDRRGLGFLFLGVFDAMLLVAGLLLAYLAADRA
jgi:hypothetical protein